MSEQDTMKFPCPKDGEYTTISDCDMCKRKMNCDIYATMPDEVNDR